MDELTKRMTQLSSAEEFLDFFELSFDQAVVNVSRLHILKRFYQYLRRDADIPTLSDQALLFGRYRELLAQAYQDFVTSTPAQEKVFKVFQDSEGKQSVSLDHLRATLPSLT